jgi:hypothetical protein
MQQSLLDRLVELMERDYPKDWARLCHLAHSREQAFTELIAFAGKHQTDQLAHGPTHMPQGLLGLAGPAQDHEIVGVAHHARAEAALQPEHPPSQHDLDPVPTPSPEEAARAYLRRYQRRGALEPIPSVEIDWLCGRFVGHFADVVRDRLVGRKKGTLEKAPIDSGLVRARTLRFDPDELVLDGGELIIVDVRVGPAPDRLSVTILGPEMRSEPEQPPTPAPLPDAAPALVRKLSGKEWVSTNFKAELRALTITEAANALAKRSETASNCIKPLQPRYVEKVLRDFGLWPKAPRGSPKQRPSK